VVILHEVEIDSRLNQCAAAPGLGEEAARIAMPLWQNLENATKLELSNLDHFFFYSAQLLPATRKVRAAMKVQTFEHIAVAL
jgi:hypothetical protein